MTSPKAKQTFEDEFFSVNNRDTIISAVKTKERCRSASPPPQIGTTEKYQAMVELIQKKLEN